MKAAGSKSRAIGIASSGTPRASSSRAKSHAPGSCSWSMSMRTSHPRSASLGSSESRCASEPGDAGDLLEVEDLRAVRAHRCGRLEDTLGPVLDRVTGRHPLAQHPADRGALRRGHHRQPLDARRQLLGVVARELERHEQAVQQLVEDGIRGDHGQAARPRLVDDLVGRAGLHVVDEAVGAAEDLRAPPSAARPHRDARASRGRARRPDGPTRPCAPAQPPTTQGRMPPAARRRGARSPRTTVSNPFARE